MCVKLLPKNLNPDLYPLHPTSTYTCGVTTALRVPGGLSLSLIKRATMFVKLSFLPSIECGLSFFNSKSTFSQEFFFFPTLAKVLNPLSVCVCVGGGIKAMSHLQKIQNQIE